MGTSVDLIDTYNQIREFWPDFNFRKEDLQMGKPEFVVQFYTAFMAELNEKISYFINEEVIDEFDALKDIDQQVVLYCKMSKIVRKIMQNAPSLMDFYTNNSKIYPFLKFSVHFLVYINNYLDEIHNLFGTNFKKLEDIEKLRILKSEKLMENAKNAETLGRLTDFYEKEHKRFEEARGLYELMLTERAESEKILEDKKRELNKAKTEIDDLEYELLCLENNERELREAIVTEAEYESLLSMEKCVLAESQQYDNQVAIPEFVSAASKEIAHYEKVAKQLKAIRVECDPAETLGALKMELKTNSDIMKKSKDDLNSVAQQKSIKRNRFRKTKSLLVRAKTQFAETESHCVQEKAKEEEARGMKAAKCCANFKEYQKVNTEIDNNKAAMLELGEKEHTLDVTIAENYRRILESDKNATTKFNNMLQRFGEGA